MAKATARKGQPGFSQTPDEVAATRERDLRVVGRVRKGESFDAIAQAEGFADRSGAWRAFWRVVRRNEADGVDQLRAAQAEQIDAALAVWVPKMLDGDKDAAVVTLRLWERQAKLFGMDAPARMIANVVDEIPDDPEERRAVILSLVHDLAEGSRVPDSG